MITRILEKILKWVNLDPKTETQSQKQHSGCPHCKFINERFLGIKKGTLREYWLMTEVFVYLHNVKDFCDYNGGLKSWLKKS